MQDPARTKTDHKGRSTQSSGTFFRRGLLTSVVACLPLLIFMNSNLGQVSTQAVVKPVIWVFAVTFLLWGTFTFLLRSPDKSSILLILLSVLFFSFGHVDDLFQKIDIFNAFYRPGFLFIAYCVFFLGGFLVIARHRQSTRLLFFFLEIVAVLLLVFNTFNILKFEFTIHQSTIKTTINDSVQTDESDQPDIYYLVLDAYARDDLLKNYYGFDNSSFLNALKERGFYIPECAWSNFDATLDTITSVLNMNYLNALSNKGMNFRQISAAKIDLLQNSYVRHYFSELGYQFVTTRGFAEFNDIRDSDLYLNYYTSQGLPDELSERSFMTLFLDTTLLRMINNSSVAEQDLSPSENDPSTVQSAEVKERSTTYLETDFWYHQINYTFDELEKLPALSENTLAYIHINSPHGPYVFTADGSFRTPADSNDERIMYTDSITYLNQRLLDLIDTLLTESEVPPIIILQSDHGTHAFDYGINKHKILSAYYLPGELTTEPYDTLTPVNDFRLVLRNYFDPQMELLPDTLYVRENGTYQSIPAQCSLEP